MPGLKDYSTTPANNTALFPEGMAPSQVNDSARQLQADIREWYNDAEWVIYGDGDGSHAIAYGSAASFSVSGANVTAAYHAGRRVRAVGTLTGTIYGTIASSAFATNTTVTVTWDSGALQNEALTIYLAVLSRNNSSLPANAARTDVANSFTATQSMSGAAFNEAAEVALASAATVNIGAAAANSVQITGTTTITGLGSAAAGIRRSLRFAGALTLTHNATSLILPGGANIATAANDTAEFLSLGSGNWVCTAYKRQDGTALAFSDVNALATTDNPPSSAYVAGSTGGATNRKFRVGEVGGWCVLEEQIASNSVGIVFVLTSYVLDFETFRFEFVNVSPTNDNVDLQYRVNTSGSTTTFDSSVGDYGWRTTQTNSGGVSGAGSNSTSLLQINGANGLSNVGGETLSGWIEMYGATSTVRTQFVGCAMHHTATNLTETLTHAGERLAAQDTDAIQFFMSSGNIASGKIVLLGRRKVQ
jgi:hypothetical protein